MTDPNALKEIVETLEFLSKAIITNDERLLELTNALIQKVEDIEVKIEILHQRIQSLESYEGKTH